MTELQRKISSRFPIYCVKCPPVTNR